MGIFWGRVAALLATAVLGLVLALAGTAAADGDDDKRDDPTPTPIRCPAGEANGDGRLLDLNDFAFDVCQVSADPQDGTGSFGSDIDGFPEGPVTCVDVRGDTVGFLYEPDEGPNAGDAFLMTAIDGGPDGPDLIGLVPGTPGGTCAPVPASAGVPVTSGSITVIDRLESSGLLGLLGAP